MANVDRKTIIASFDVLAQSFHSGDPISHDLEVMARVVSKMSDDEFAGRTRPVEAVEEALLRTAAESMTVEAKKKMIKKNCPSCDGSVFLMSPDQEKAYCMKEKKTVKMTGKKEEKESNKKKKKASDWSKEASDAVKAALLKDVAGMDMVPEVTEEKKESPKTQMKEEKPSTEDTKKPETVKEEKKESPETQVQEEVKEVKEEKKADQNSPHPQQQSAPVVVPSEGAPEAEEPAKELPVVPQKNSGKECGHEGVCDCGKPTEEVIDKDSVVDTKVLKTASSMSTFDTIEMSPTMLLAEDTADLTAQEKANLDKLF